MVWLVLNSEVQVVAYGDFVEILCDLIKCLLGKELTFEESPYSFFNIGKQDMERVNNFK